MGFQPFLRRSSLMDVQRNSVFRNDGTLSAEVHIERASLVFFRVAAIREGEIEVPRCGRKHAKEGRLAMGAIDVLAIGDLLAKRASASADDVDGVCTSRLS